MTWQGGRTANRSAAALALLAAGVLVCIPEVQAFPVVGVIECGSPAVVFGLVIAHSESDAVLATYGVENGKAPRLRFEGLFESFDLVEQTTDYVRAGGVRAERPLQPSDGTRTAVATRTGSMEAESPESLYTIAIQLKAPTGADIRDGEVGIRPAGTHVVSGSQGQAGNTIEPFSSGSDTWPNLLDVVLAKDSLDVETNSGRGAYDGNATLYLAGFSLRVRNETGTFTLRTGVWNETLASDPISGAPLYWRKHISAVVMQVAGRIEWEFVTPYTHLLAPVVRLDGVAHFVAPLGTLKLSGPSANLDLPKESVVDVFGNFGLQGPTTSFDGRMRFSLDGDVTSVQQTKLLVRDYSNWQGPAVAGALSLLALLSWLAMGGRRALQVLWTRLFPGYPGYTVLKPHEALRAPARRAIHDALSQRGPIRMHDLIAAVGQSRGQVRAEVRHLVESGLIVQEKRGRAVWVASKGRSEDLPILPDDRLATALRTACETEPAAFRRVVSTVREATGLTRMGAWYAVRRAEKEGVIAIRREPDGLWVSWSARRQV